MNDEPPQPRNQFLPLVLPNFVWRFITTIGDHDVWLLENQTDLRLPRDIATYLCTASERAHKHGRIYTVQLRALVRGVDRAHAKMHRVTDEVVDFMEAYARLHQ